MQQQQIVIFAEIRLRFTHFQHFFLIYQAANISIMPEWRAEVYIYKLKKCLYLA